MRLRTFSFALILAVCICAPAFAVQYAVSVDTSSVSGTSGYISLQLNPGNATSQPVTATITGFSAGTGTLTGAPSPVGDVTGTLPGTVILTNSTPLNEYFQGIDYGNTITFIVDLTGPAIDAPNGTATGGTTFSVSLFDSGVNPILTNQNGPFDSGAVGLLDVNLDGSVTPTAYPNAGNGPSVVTFQLIQLDFLFFYWFFAS